MGIVYEAVDPVIERRVAVKTIRRAGLDADEAADHAARFLVEAKAAGKLNHPNIVGLYDHGNEDGLAYMVMELVQGRELQHWFDNGRVFRLDEVLRLMAELLDALGYSHRRGVIHRDVKPANIFITDDGHLKLGDFGIARIESGQKTRIGSALGTPSHMAPEQIRGEAVDARADLYAAGVVLFQLLTNQRPFNGPMLAMSLKVLNEPAPAPSQLRPGLPAALDAVLATALAKHPQARYPHAAAFWQALAEACGESAAAFRPIGLGGPPGTAAPGTVAPGTAATPAPQGGTGLHGNARPAAAGANATRTRALAIGGGAVALMAVAGAAWWWAGSAASPSGSRTPTPALGPSPSPERADAMPPPGGPSAASAAAQTSAAPAPPGVGPTAAPGPPPAAAVVPPTGGVTEAERAAPSGRTAPPPNRPARDSARAAPERPPTFAAPPPHSAGNHPAKCSDILQKASLEPLTADEATYLRSACQ